MFSRQTIWGMTEVTTDTTDPRYHTDPLTGVGGTGGLVVRISTNYCVAAVSDTDV